MQETKQLVGERIKTLRKRAGLTQEQLAERVGLDARHLSRLETGKHFPTMDSLERIAGVLNAPMAEFFQFRADETTEALRSYLAGFAEKASDAQLRLAVRVIRLVTN